MKTYYFKTTKEFLALLTAWFSFFGGFVLLVNTLPQGVRNMTTLIFCLVGLLCFTIYMVKLTSFAKVEITIDYNTISIKWLQRFLIGNKPDVTISFNEIASYDAQEDVLWHWLKIKMKDGNTYKFYHSIFLFKDDYSKFVAAFVASIKNHNMIRSGKDNLPKIKRTKALYETTGGLILAGFAMVFMIGFPILLIVFPYEKQPNYFLFGLGYIGAIYFVFQVYTHRKKNKTN